MSPFATLSCSLSLIFREAYHFHWVQVPTLLSLAHALSPGGKAQIPYKVMPPEIAPSSSSDLLACPTQTFPCIVTREAQPRWLQLAQVKQTDLPES